MKPTPPPPPPPPYDARIEYLESNGLQWINSEILSATPMECRASVMLFVESDFTIVGSRNPNRFYLLHNYYGWCFGMWNYHSTFDMFELNKRFEIYSKLHSGDQKFSVDGQVVMTAEDTPDLEDNTTVRIFGSARVRLYNVELLKNDVKLRDYIPVRIGEVGYMYDKVSGELFGNSGSGSFILGPDIE